MFGLGPSEIIAVVIVALLLFGPKKLPEMMRSLGRSIAEFKRTTREVSDQIARSMMDEELPPDKATRPYPYREED